MLKCIPQIIHTAVHLPALCIANMAASKDFSWMDDEGWMCVSSHPHQVTEHNLGLRSGIPGKSPADLCLSTQKPHGNLMAKQ